MLLVAPSSGRHVLKDMAWTRLMAEQLENLFRGNLEQDPYLARSPKTIRFISQVAPNEFLKVFCGPFSGNLNNLSSNGYRTFWTSRIQDTEHDARVALDIAQLLVSFDGIDEQILPIRIDPGLR